MLKKITSPEDLKSLSYEELLSLSKEIRKRIVDVMSVNGGHLASNLGMVELTLAMHTIFSSPKDKFIFDVSHQSYTHKILTGRNEEFDTVRQYKGISGFTHPEESEHDHFFAGHAGTALSLALGMATTRDLSASSETIIPVVGDATFTCGLTFEALNNLHKNVKNFIVLLNDNHMSISKNVGNITRLLSSDKGCPEKFFSQFDLEYIGPIDGHNLKECLEAFEKAKNLDHPVIIHAKTVKGQGMPTAIENPTTYHGAKPFDKITGIFHPIKSKPTFPKIFGEALLEMAEEDPDLLAVTPAMPAGSCITNFMKKHKKRCFDVGIAEGHAVTFAAGLAFASKKKVVASIYSTFLQRALDNVYHDVCLQKIPVVFALDRGGIAGGDGATHNGIYDIGFLNEMPNMIIAQPRDGQVLVELLHAAFSWKKPTTIRYPNLPTNAPTLPMKKRALGVAEVLLQGNKEAADVAIISLGHLASLALDVSHILREEGINTTVIDPVFLKPLDTDLFSEIFSTHQMVVTIEEHSIAGGLGSIINSFITQNQFTHCHVMNFGIEDTFIEHGKHPNLLAEIGLTKENISTKILHSFSRSAL